MAGDTPISARATTSPAYTTQEMKRELGTAQQKASKSVGSALGSSRGEDVRSLHEELSPISVAAKKLTQRNNLLPSAALLRNRTLRQGQGTNLQAATRLVQEYQDKLPGMPSHTALQGLVEQMQSYSNSWDEGEYKTDDEGGGVLAEMGGEAGAEETGKARPTKRTILSILQGFDQDPTHQFAALDMARKYFAESKSSTKQFEELLSQAAEEFEKNEELARDVRAGFASAKIAQDAAATLETNPATVRDTYRSLLREQKNMGQLFDSLLKFDVMKKFTEIVDTFRKVVGEDLASTGPSTDPAFLHALLTELGKLKRLETVFEMNKSLVSTTDRQVPGGISEGMDATKATSLLLNFASKATVNIMDARQLLSGLEHMEPKVQLVFLNGIRDIYGHIPSEILSSLQARLQQIAILASLQGYLVTAEQDYFEKQREERRRQKKLKDKETAARSKTADSDSPLPPSSRTLLGISHKQDKARV